MIINNVTFFEGTNLHAFYEFVRKELDGKGLPIIFSENNFQCVRNVLCLSTHEFVEKTLIEFLDMCRMENCKHPIVIFDAFFHFDIGKKMTKLLNKMYDLNCEIYVFLPKCKNNWFS